MINLLRTLSCLKLSFYTFTKLSDSLWEDDLETKMVGVSLSTLVLYPSIKIEAWCDGGKTSVAGEGWKNGVLCPSEKPQFMVKVRS